MVDRIREEDCKTPLRQACLKDISGVVKALLALPGIEGRLDLPDKRRNPTPLHVAALLGHELIVKMLLDKGGKSLPDKRAETPLQLCCERWNTGAKTEQESIVMMLLDKDSSEVMHDSTALFAAAQMGSLKVVQRLLDFGANPNVADDHGWKPVHVSRAPPWTVKRLSQLKQVVRLNRHHPTVKLLEHGGVVGLAPSRMIIPKDQEETAFDEIAQMYKHVSKDGEGSRHVLVGDHPIRVAESRFYHEVEIQPKQEEIGSDNIAIAVGLCQKPKRTKGWLLGWYWLGGTTYCYNSLGLLYDSGRSTMLEGFNKFSFGETLDAASTHKMALSSTLVAGLYWGRPSVTLVASFFCV